MTALFRQVTMFLVYPMGFCAGVSRAVTMLENASKIYADKTIYVRNAIVNNKSVVDAFEHQGVKFIQNIKEIPTGSITVLSAHGSSRKVFKEAEDKSLEIIDAICPLVKTVHKKAITYNAKGYYIILIGHKNHPEIEGTLGQVNDNITLISTSQDIDNLKIPKHMPIICLTQTTLSYDDTHYLITLLKDKHPNILADKSNVCYATQNRQDAVKSMINKADLLLVIGSSHSSNSKRLKEIGDKNNKISYLLDEIKDIPWNILNSSTNILFSAGASAPKALIDLFIETITVHFKKSQNVDFNVKTIKHKEETEVFYVPKALRIDSI